MKYLVDTDIASYFAIGKFPKLQKKMQAEASNWAISSITYHELWRGLMQTKNLKVEMYLTDFLKSVRVLTFDQLDAQESGRINFELQSTGQSIGYNDTLIAGQALANRLVLVTNNVKHFSRVKDLPIQNWTK